MKAFIMYGQKKKTTKTQKVIWMKYYAKYSSWNIKKKINEIITNEERVECVRVWRCEQCSHWKGLKYDCKWQLQIDNWQCCTKQEIGVPQKFNKKENHLFPFISFIDWFS